MKIDDVSLTIFTWDGIPPTQYHAGSFAQPTSDLGLLRIRTDAGAEGHAFLGGASNPASTDGKNLIRWLKPLLMGANPLDRERIHQRMQSFTRVTGYRPMGAVDVALWDLAGKIAGMPIHQLLGSFRSTVPAYASSQLLPSPAAYVEQAQSFRDRGWRAYKIHPPQVLAEDIRICEAVRQGLGDDFTIMLDATWGYGYEEALRLGRAIEQLDYHWYEDPLRDEDIYGYVRLKQKLDIPIMATEAPAGGLDTYAIWITERATDYLRGDVPSKGGITNMVKTAHLAEAFGLRYEIHHSSNSLNNVANLHVTMAIRNCEFFEVLLPDGAHKYGLVNDITVGADGLVHAPMGPGLGAEIDFDMIKRKTETVLR